MKLLKASILFIAVSILPQPSVLAQPASDTSSSLAGEWLMTGVYEGPVVVVEQKGTSVKGSWKGSWRERGITCTGTWFDGKISGDTVNGRRYSCGGRSEPLSMRIRDADTLEVDVLAIGGTG